MDRAERDVRETLVALARRMASAGLVTGTSGNLSARVAGPLGRILVTPSGVDYETMATTDLVVVDDGGQPALAGLKPSIDTPKHVAIYRARPDVGAVVHTHSPYATAFSMVGEPIPALLIEVAGYLGGPVRVMPYVSPLRPDLPDVLASALGADRAILVANHGVYAVGETPAKAFHAAVDVEDGARAAWLARALGTPNAIPVEDVAALHEFLHTRYGQTGE